MFGGNMLIGNTDALAGTVLLVDPAVLRHLAESLDSRYIAARFASDFVAMWDLRRRRLAAALTRSNLPEAVDAVISMRVASTMVGGHRLALRARQVEDAVNRGDFATARVLMAQVETCGAETVAELAHLGDTELALCSRHL